MNHTHYLDNAATSKASPAAVQAAVDAMERVYGNPSSQHTMGIEAETLIRRARTRIAALISCKSEEIIFTSGATEANNLALLGAMQAGQRRGKHIITTSIEHPAVYDTVKHLESAGWEVSYIPPLPDGTISPESVARLVRDDTLMVSVMLVNNETGMIQPVGEIARAVKAVNGKTLIHTDAVQAAGKINIDVNALYIDLLSLSGHKMFSPKGVGALYIKKGVRIAPIIYGGGQENGLRSGTEAVALIAAMGEAAREVREDLDTRRGHVRALREEAQRVIGGIDGVKIINPGSIPHIMNLCVPGYKSETLVHRLARDGVYVSAGSACSGKSKGKNRALSEQGINATDIESFLRISFSHENTSGDIEALRQVLLKAIFELHKQ